MGGGVSVPFSCCWPCPFHSDARRHGRGGRCSQPLPFIPGSRGERRGSRLRGERGRAPPRPGERPKASPPAGAHFPSNLAITARLPRGRAGPRPRGAPRAWAGRPRGAQRSLPPWSRGGRRGGAGGGAHLPVGEGTPGGDSRARRALSRADPSLRSRTRGWAVFYMWSVIYRIRLPFRGVLGVQGVRALFLTL